MSRPQPAKVHPFIARFALIRNFSGRCGAAGELRVPDPAVLVLGLNDYNLPCPFKDMRPPDGEVRSRTADSALTYQWGGVEQRTKACRGIGRTCKGPLLTDVLHRMALDTRQIVN